MTGKEIYQAILRDNGQSVDYLLVAENMSTSRSTQIKVAQSSKWNWSDFEALVGYEKSENLSHEYSAMLAVRLMSGMIVNAAFNKLSAAEEKTFDNRKELFQTIQANLWILFATRRIEMWDASQGVYFSEYVKKDILRIINDTIDRSHISGLSEDSSFPVILSPITGDFQETVKEGSEDNGHVEDKEQMAKYNEAILKEDAELFRHMEIREQQEFSNMDFDCIELKPQFLQAVAFADLFLGGTDEWPSNLIEKFYANCMNMIRKKDKEIDERDDLI